MQKRLNLKLNDLTGSYNRGDKVITFYDKFKNILGDSDCIIAFESAADMMGLSNGGLRNTVQVYSLYDLKIPYVECHIVDDYNNIDIYNHRDLKCTTVNQTIIDLLKDDNADEQILTETLGNYYYENNQSFHNLNIPVELQDKFNKYSDWGIEYYDTK